MASRKLRRSSVPADVCERLSRHHIETCQDLLSLTALEVMCLAGQSYAQACQLLRLVSQICAPKMTTALELWKQRADQYFPTSLAALDHWLQGGLACGTLTEMTGPAGCGKSQLCMMLSVLATLPRSMGGLDGGVVYIDTESAFSAERLVEIAQNRFPDHFSDRKRIVEMAGRVHLFRELTCRDVLNRLQHLEEDIISCQARLVILDSMASVVRKEFELSLPGNLVHRSNLLGQQAAMLKCLAQEFSIPVKHCSNVKDHLWKSLQRFRDWSKEYVSEEAPGCNSEKHVWSLEVLLTNQITTHLGERPSVSSKWNSLEGFVLPGDGDSGYVTAALGNTWSHTVNTRLILQYLDSCQRQIIVAKSPVAPFAVFNYSVQRDGIQLEGDSNQADPSHQGTDPGLQPIRVRTGFNCNLTQVSPTGSHSRSSVS
ncbi:DNA repair protein RAD51 homolog 2 isoform X1 [Scleropages formosus]|uniref:RAD51 paralog B n=1 Tax=Scleropages formosus TaxID=113540 RepID=A0A8C9QWF2_SCLFO|nr:DNA repair protein RAD51 homolog 2 isoform X1 [Scleropages formosus]